MTLCSVAGCLCRPVSGAPWCEDHRVSFFPKRPQVDPMTNHEAWARPHVEGLSKVERQRAAWAAQKLEWKAKRRAAR